VTGDGAAFSFDRKDLLDDFFDAQVALNPSSPLAQNLHPYAHPTCVETQSV